MIKVENIEVFNFEGAVRGMRNPMNSHNKSDSEFTPWDDTSFTIGKNDLDLMKRLYKAGTEHRKYLRQIFVSMDITAPLYWISEFDTYKVGTTRNSCSFMHKGTTKPFEVSDFSIHNDRVAEILSSEDFEHDPTKDTDAFILSLAWQETINTLNNLRDKYLETKDDNIFQQIRCMLPSGYNQKFTITMNYENVINMIHQRENHRLQEWREFVGILKDLPYIKEITADE